MANEKINTLLVDDEASFRRALKTSLSALGYGTEESRNGEEALELLNQGSFDLILLDINMPGIGGVETCREIRARDLDIGVVMVSVRDGENDLVQALEAGADDYITKPIRFRELLARMGAVLRRIRPENHGEPEILRVGELELDMRRHVLCRNGEPVHLTPTEFHLLALLMENQGFPVTHVKLLRSIWGPEYGSELDYLRSFVKALRKKIETNPSDPQYIITEPWVGYRLCDPLNQQFRYPKSN
ncbi:MAG TPA: response regulator transcription factor [Candidatus Sulfotelmatobacter sp.]|nr:response regulator transcription factor [Candidatus Sulfotelmatobacter sp.]